MTQKILTKIGSLRQFADSCDPELSYEEVLNRYRTQISILICEYRARGEPGDNAIADLLYLMVAENLDYVIEQLEFQKEVAAQFPDETEMGAALKDCGEMLWTVGQTLKNLDNTLDKRDGEACERLYHRSVAALKPRKEKS